jgi:hypothetical protein|tara:strand:+ start:305 stop:2563 length:2259 start_codon:yes stop_codon:yes gene_type:complete
MALPLLTGAITRTLAKKSANKSSAIVKKPYVDKKQEPKKTKSGAGLVKTTSYLDVNRSRVKSGSKINFKKFVSDSKKTTKTQTTGKPKKLGTILNQMIATLKSIDKSLKKSSKQEEKESKKFRIFVQKEKSKKREKKLEEKKKDSSILGRTLGGVRQSKPIQALMRFFSSILLGSLVLGIINNGEKIIATFDAIKSGMDTSLEAIRIAIISFSNIFKRPITSIFRGGKFIFKQFKRLGSTVGRLFKFSIKGLRKLFVERLGKFTPGFIKRSITGVDNAASAAPQVLRRLDPLRRSKRGMIRLFGKRGFKHLTSVSRAFKRVPFVGALIGIGIDLALGERIDNAIAGAIGASLGATIGGAIGQGLIPIPIVGAAVGAFVGGGIGDWAGKELYKNLTGQIQSDIEPPEGFGDDSKFSLQNEDRYNIRESAGPVIESSIDFGGGIVLPRRRETNTTGYRGSLSLSGAGVKAARAYATSKGYGPALTSGMLSTIQNESSFNPYAVGDGGNSYGLFQFNEGAGRRQPFLDFLKNSGIPNPSVLFTNVNHPDRAKYRDKIFELTLIYMMEREQGRQLVRDYKNSSDLRTIMGGWEDIERYAGSQTRLPRNQRNNLKYRDRLDDAEFYLQQLKSLQTSNNPIKPVSNQYMPLSESLLAMNQGPSTPIKYDPGMGQFVPNQGAGRPGKVRLKPHMIPKASRTQPSSLASADDNQTITVPVPFPISNGDSNIAQAAPQIIPIVIGGDGGLDLSAQLSAYTG